MTKIFLPATFTGTRGNIVNPIDIGYFVPETANLINT